VIQAGWRVLRIWECEIKTSPATAAQTVLRFVQSDPVIEV
jgi:G:T-mismatch repair DNA endonuclease (very short patch repair protein)